MNTISFEYSFYRLEFFNLASGDIRTENQVFWQPTQAQSLELGIPVNDGDHTKNHLRLGRIITENSRLYYVIFRGKALWEELASLKRNTEADILDAVFWNDALAFFFDEKRMTWNILANRACSLPVFWCKTGTGYLASNRVIPDLKSSTSGFDVDPIGWAEALLWDSPLRGRTIWKGINQLSSGYCLELERGAARSVCYNTLSLFGTESSDFHELAGYAAQLNETAVLNSLAPNQKYLVPLSGGLDSRAILGSLKKSDERDVLTVSFGHARSYDLSYAKLVADKLSVPIQQHILDEEHYQSDFAQFYSISGGIYHLMHCHLVASMLKVRESDRQVLVGFMGDPVAGADAGCDHSVDSPEAAVQHMLHRGGHTIKSLQSCFSREIADGIIKDIEHLYQDCLRKNPPAYFDEYYFVVERQSMLITHLFNSLLSIVDSIGFPFMDGNWARFYLNLSPTFRSKRALYKASLVKGFPELSFIPSTSSYTTLTASERIIQLKYLEQRLVRRTQSVIELLSNGRLSIPNSFQTENLPFILNTVLASGLNHAALDLHDRGFLSQHFVQYLSQRHFSARHVPAAFRVISLAAFLG